MKIRVQMLLATVASIITLIGVTFSVGTLVSVRSVEQLRHLLSYDYVSFVDSLAIGDVANDFYTGIALIAVGGMLFTKIERTSRTGKWVGGLALLFIAFTLIYACLHTRVGILPY